MFRNLGIFSLGMMNVCVVDKVGSTVLEILDGQQRLVTLCLILAAIRKKLLDGREDEEAKFAHGCVRAAKNGLAAPNMITGLNVADSRAHTRPK